MRYDIYIYIYVVRRQRVKAKHTKKSALPWSALLTN